MRILSSKEVIRRLKQDGLTLKSVEGSHHQFSHPQKSGKVTVPHPYKDLSPGTLRSIAKQSGVNLE